MGRLGGRRLAVGGLSFVGLAVAVYLTLFQAKVFRTVWDPFSSGSPWILRRSPLVRWLRFPDAALGVVAYGAELVLSVTAVEGGPGGRRRGSHLALGALAAAMGLGSVVLVGLQAVYGHWCTLCLVSASAGVAVAALVVPDVRRALDRRASPKGAGHGGSGAAKAAAGGRMRGV
jgi:uncharacterized membrane protein